MGGRRIGAVIVAGAFDLTLMLSGGTELKLLPIPIDSLFTRSSAVIKFSSGFLGTTALDVDAVVEPSSEA